MNGKQETDILQHRYVGGFTDYNKKIKSSRDASSEHPRQHPDVTALGSWVSRRVNFLSESHLPSHYVKEFDLYELWPPLAWAWFCLPPWLYLNEM